MVSIKETRPENQGVPKPRPSKAEAKAVATTAALPNTQPPSAAPAKPDAAAQPVKNKAGAPKMTPIKPETINHIRNRIVFDNPSLSIEAMTSIILESFMAMLTLPIGGKYAALSAQELDGKRTPGLFYTSDVPPAHAPAGLVAMIRSIVDAPARVVQSWPEEVRTLYSQRVKARAPKLEPTVSTPPSPAPPPSTAPSSTSTASWGASTSASSDEAADGSSQFVHPPWAIQLIRATHGITINPIPGRQLMVEHHGIVSTGDILCRRCGSDHEADHLRLDDDCPNPLDKQFRKGCIYWGEDGSARLFYSLVHPGHLWAVSPDSNWASLLYQKG